ncbi:hypothetical protein TURU_089414 [Turdus rufiventris]|nr:hypothetical protein TURU_089414 [Turdus rufiventris]
MPRPCRLQLVLNFVRKSLVIVDQFKALVSMMGSGMKFDSWLRKILLSSPLMAMKLQLFEQTALYKSRLEKSIILEPQFNTSTWERKTRNEKSFKPFLLILVKEPSPYSLYAHFRLIDGGSNSHERLQMCCIVYFNNETDLTLAVAKGCTFTMRLHDVLMLPNFIESLPKYERYMMK